jgi:hypothetical protein
VVQRVVVTSGGIVVTSETEPLMSMHGKEMRPGSRIVDELPWSDISCVSLSAVELPPDGELWISMTVDLTWGEFFEVHEDAEGFAEAVAQLSLFSGIPTPHRASLTAAGIEIWGCPGH